MHPALADGSALLGAWLDSQLLNNTLSFLKVLIGFSIIIFVHELGHFLAAKWVGVRVDRFAVGFGYRLVGWRRGEGLTFGNQPNLSHEEMRQKGYGETDYCFKALPLGGYVKMLGQDDIVIDEKTGAVQLSDDPRAFTSRPVGQRMIVVSAGVVFNLLFAALLLMWVFLTGISMGAPVIGDVLPDSPANGKLLPGDRVLAINGRHTHSFKEIAIAPILADGPLRFRVERDGQVLDDDIVIEPVLDEGEKIRTIGVGPFVTAVFARDGNLLGDEPTFRRGDRITQVDGKPVQSVFDIFVRFANSHGRPLDVTVARPDPRNPAGEPQVVTHAQRAVLELDSAELPDPSQSVGRSIDNRHLLGLQLRRQVAYVEAGWPAEKAGFRVGDVIARWGAIASPLNEEIFESIRVSPSRPIPVAVERAGEPRALTVTPRRPFRLWGQVRPRVGLYFARPEEDRPVVANVAPGTPAAALNLPRGSLILAIDDQPVNNWFEVAETLMAAAGRSVRLRYRSGDDEVTGRLAVPSSMVNELDLPPSARIWSVDDVRSVTVPGADGKTREISLISSAAIRKLLEERIGQTVKVRYSPNLIDAPLVKSFTVRSDNTDPWQMRINYTIDATRFEELKELVHSDGNPLAAVGMGLKVVSHQVLEVYSFLKHLFKRNVSVEHVAGPVGIFNYAIERARLGVNELLYFLAFLSVNLAVLNFLPLPVLDGGLMVFLLIERIKGKPLSLKTQMITTIVGLVGIILFGIFITIQDITRIFGS